jgi:hypothetical protein
LKIATPPSALRKSSAPSSSSHLSWLANRCLREVRRVASAGGRPLCRQGLRWPVLPGRIFRPVVCTRHDDAAKLLCGLPLFLRAIRLLPAHVIAPRNSGKQRDKSAVQGVQAVGHFPNGGWRSRKRDWSRA